MTIMKTYTWALAFPPVGQAFVATRGPADCCSVLQSQHQDYVFFPGSSGYQVEASDSYWSGTAHLNPACVFAPSSAEIVSAAVILFEEKNCTFAIRSGGHSTAKGAANIDGGVLLATTNLSTISLGSDYVSVGPGLRWGSVYNFLEPYGLVVVGGRGGEVGVGGLVLGGGVSHFTPELGFACDNVKAFEIVTASGKILEANADSNQDLWQALKGSQNMFGVVTRLDLYTFTSPSLHEVSVSVNMTDFDQVADAYDNYVRSRWGNNDALQMAVSMTSYYVSLLGPPTLEINLLSSSEKNNQSWLADNDSAVLRLPTLLSGVDGLPATTPPTESWGSMAEFASGAATPKLRYDLRTLSFRSSTAMLKGMRQIVEEEFARAILEVTGFSGIVEWQLITKNAITKGTQKGSNVLGLEGAGPLIVFAMANSWSDASGDEAAQAAAQRVVERGETLAKQLGTYLPFLYANYAANGQDVFTSYGEKNVAKLSQVRKKYDPENLLYKLIPGGLSGMGP